MDVELINKLLELEIGLHKKLININNDIRMRRNKKENFSSLVEKKKLIDKTVSQIQNINKKPDQQTWQIYNQFLEIFRSN